MNRTHHNQPSPFAAWKTLLLGGLLGYLLAILAAAVSESRIVPSATTLRLSHRWLSSSSSESLEIGAQDEEEEQGWGTDETEEHEADALTLDTTVAVIVVFLIVLTILFEHVKESMEEAADRIMKPVIQGLFGELTVLGFLSMVTFFITKMGWFTVLSEHLFGHEEEEELLETFEFVHYMLFFIMVFFVITVLILVHGGQAMEKTWWTWNAACAKPSYMAQLDALSAPGREKTTYLQHLWYTLFPCCRSSTARLRSDLQLFRGLRQEFVLERSDQPPFAANATNQVEDDFNFGRYLSICLGHELAHMVHLHNSTWAFLGLVTLVFYGIALGVGNSMEDFAWVWAASGWLIFLLGNYFDYHMVYILENMAGDCSSFNTGDGSGGESGALMASPLPNWTRIDLDQYMEKRRSLLAKCCLPSKRITRQDSLYWMERKGPKLYLILFQIQMVFTAAYVSLLILSFFPFLFTKAIESNVERWCYVVASILPVYLLLSKYHAAAANLTMACSIGVHRRPQAVSQVIREAKTDRIIRAMVTMQKLQLAASNGFATPHHAGHGNGHLSNITSSEELEEVGKTFDSLDSSGNGKISSLELDSVLRALGATTTEDSLARIVALLDKNKDGTISRQEFLDFYQAHMTFDLGHHGIHHLAHHMFGEIDHDGNGEITLSEFKNVLDAFNVGFSVDEIGDLVNELDEQDNGTIGAHEFVELLEKHNHLFERIELPKLE